MSICVTGSPWRMGEFIYPDDDTGCRLLGEHVDHLHLILCWSCKLTSPPAMTPGHCQHRSVSPITLTTREGQTRLWRQLWGPLEPPAQKQTRDSSCCTGRAFCDMRLANEWRTSDTVCSSHNWTQTGMICSEINHSVLPYSVHDSDFTSAPIEESCFGSKRADTPAFLKETWHPKQPSDLSLGSKALHLQDWNF